MMDDQSERYGKNIAKLIDSQVTGKEFEFDQILLMPTAKGYRALVEQAEKENFSANHELLGEEMVKGNNREPILICHGSVCVFTEHIRPPL